MSLTTSDIEEYLVRKAIDAGYTNPTLMEVSGVKSALDYTEAIVQSYLDEQRGFESQSDYVAIVALINALKAEVPE